VLRSTFVGVPILPPGGPTRKGALTKANAGATRRAGHSLAVALTVADSRAGRLAPSRRASTLLNHDVDAPACWYMTGIVQATGYPGYSGLILRIVAGLALRAAAPRFAARLVALGSKVATMALVVVLVATFGANFDPLIRILKTCAMVAGVLLTVGPFAVAVSTFASVTNTSTTSTGVVTRAVQPAT